MKQLLRWLLWKVCRRDVLVLHPTAAVVSRHADYTLISHRASARRRYLPMRYNYHTPPDWRLEYHLRAVGSGQLQYQLAAPGKEAFAVVQRRLTLPATWTVRLEGQGLVVNGEPVSLLPGKTIPRDTFWLVADFTFQPDAGEAMFRRTGHRLQLPRGATDQRYFNGAVYAAYEAQAEVLPQQILATIARHRPLQGRLLDVGCATGLLVEHALRRGLDAEGTDVSAWAVARANERAPGRCRVLDFDAATVTDFSARYDVITMHSVLEHLADPAQAMRLLFELCAPGGVALIQTLNADSLMHRLLDQDWAGYTDYTHQSPWITADWLYETAVAAGFEVLAWNCHGVWCENQFDDAWRAFQEYAQLPPASALLADQWGDAVEVVLRRSTSRPSAPPRPAIS